MQVDLGGQRTVGGIREALLFPGCADFQPLYYLNGLADAIVNKYGGRIFEHSQVMQTKGKQVSCGLPVSFLNMASNMFLMAPCNCSPAFAPLPRINDVPSV